MNRLLLPIDDLVQSERVRRSSLERDQYQIE